MKVVKWLAAFVAVIVVLVAVGLIYRPLDVRTDHSISPETVTERETESHSSGERETETQTPDDPKESDGDNQGAETRPSLRWEEINDVDALIDSLTTDMEDGDGGAGWQLHRLASTCLYAAMAPREIPEEMQSTGDPESLARMRSELERYIAMREPCAESELGRMSNARAVKQRALWEAALAGHQDAQYEVVFNAPPERAETESDQNDSLDLRRRMLSELRDTCHESTLHSMGIHLSRGSPVVEGLAQDNIPGHDSDASRQIKAFAHRYAAAILEDDALPARSARNEDYPLNAHEEQRAVALGDSIINGCD